MGWQEMVEKREPMEIDVGPPDETAVEE